MKKFLTIAIVIMLHASFAFGDEVGRGLSNLATEQMKANTRKMIDAGVPSKDAIEITRMMIQSRFRQEHTLKAQQILVSAVEEDLPLEPVMNKVYEGIAKNAPDEIVVRAMEKTRARYSFAYRHARRVAKDSARVQGIANAVSGSLSAGMDYPDTDRIMESIRVRTRQMTQNRIEELTLESFLAARTMTRLGVHSDSVADVICTALQQEYSAPEMKLMQNSFVERSRIGSPEKVAHQYHNAIEQGERAGNLGAHTNTGGRSSMTGSGERAGSTGESGGPGNSGSSGESEGSGGSGGSGSGSGGSGNADGAGGAGDSGGAGGSGSSGSGSGGSGNADGAGGTGGSGAGGGKR